ncbi:MAG: hypothetical protein ABIH11_01800 [Candidatus Altiarchaeota archaeon]
MEYETIVSEYVDYGRNKFIEVSRKKVLPDQTEFLNISKGYYTPDGEKRYQRGIGFPVEESIVSSLINKLQIVISSAEGSSGSSSEMMDESQDEVQESPME